MARPLIALLTDFGLRDHYVGTMKGVALGICPDAMFVDISHEIGPHDVLGGALELAAAYRYFPSATIFLAVVDPGVGSTRRGIAADVGDYRFVAPDNGVLSVVLDQTPLKLAVELTERKYARPTISKTFEGRDRFAPAAAWLANGVQLTALGRPASSLVRLDLPLPRAAMDGVDGEIVRVDRFGNLTSNIDEGTIAKLGGAVRVQVGSHMIPRIVSTYADAAPGELCALVGSWQRLEIAVNGGNAAATLGLGRGAVVQLRRGA
jgi:S-adenosyl-L-methionine hydrolase (adenosine-forming)